jgi:LmbE family N-acetylglucosaminyl deacetylase
VTETFPRKVAALRAHQSQTGHLTDLDDRIRERLARMAAQAGLPEGRLAEGFQVLETA